MSIVTVQLGQCGNQIGREVFNAICSDVHGTHGLCSKKENESYHDACKERFFIEAESGGTAFKRFVSHRGSGFQPNADKNAEIIKVFPSVLKNCHNLLPP